MEYVNPASFHVINVVDLLLTAYPVKLDSINRMLMVFAYHVLNTALTAQILSRQTQLYA